MSAPDERFVCDLRRVMRARLLCGLYTRRAVPPRWRHLAQAYCLTLAATVAFIVYFITTTFMTYGLNYYMVYFPSLAQFFVTQVVSLWTGDEFIYKFFTHNRMTDVTLDSSLVFNSLQKHLTQALIYISVYVFGFTGFFWWSAPKESGIMMITIVTLMRSMLELFDVCCRSGKFLVLSLFNARMLVLKRRLQRYGFRVVGRKPPQPYCQIYEENLKMLDATNNPLKMLLFFDMIFSSLKLMGIFLIVVYGFQRNMTSVASLVMYLTMIVPSMLMYSFGHIRELESAATHCKDMEVFTATQLIKTPTDSERQRMREFLRVLERRGARYRVLRALPLDARLVLRALGFITAQALVFVNTVLAN